SATPTLISLSETPFPGLPDAAGAAAAVVPLPDPFDGWAFELPLLPHAAATIAIATNSTDTRFAMTPPGRHAFGPASPEPWSPASDCAYRDSVVPCRCAERSPGHRRRLAHPRLPARLAVAPAARVPRRRAPHGLRAVRVPTYRGRRAALARR